MSRNATPLSRIAFLSYPGIGAFFSFSDITIVEDKSSADYFRFFRFPFPCTGYGTAFPDLSQLQGAYIQIIFAGIVFLYDLLPICFQANGESAPIGSSPVAQL